jgi:hypothetical protein
MTMFDELMDIITRNKKDKKSIPAISKSNIAEDDDMELEVSGSESRDPLVASANLDPNIIDMLYRSNRNRVPRGEGASAWDSDY